MGALKYGYTLKTMKLTEKSLNCFVRKLKIHGKVNQVIEKPNKKLMWDHFVAP